MWNITKLPCAQERGWTCQWSRGKGEQTIRDIGAADWALGAGKWTTFTNCVKKIRQILWFFSVLIIIVDEYRIPRKVVREWDLRQKWRQGRRIVAVGDSKQTLQTCEFASALAAAAACDFISFSFISCILACYVKNSFKYNSKITLIGIYIFGYFGGIFLTQSKA